MGQIAKTTFCSLSLFLLLLCQGCCVVEGCYQEMISLDSFESETIIRSLHYPELYPPNLECNFHITAPEGRKVRIEFTAFTLENEIMLDICRFDYVIVYDGDSDTDPVFGTFCGTTIPPVMVSSSRYLYVHFQSDGSVQESGFRAIVHSVDADYQESLPTNPPDSCYSIFEEDSGNFYSPGYPGSYDHNEDCTYSIVLPDETDNVILRFTSFDLEPSQSCIYDYVEVRDGLSTATPLIGRYCGGFNNEPPSVVESTGPNMYVLFHTDISAAFEGFYAEYASSGTGFLPGTNNDGPESMTSVCDISRAILTDRGGFILSHDAYPRGSYDHHSRCSVQIVGSRSYEKVFIDFLAVDLPPTSDCGGPLSDYIEVLDGQVNSDDQISLETLCESDVGRYTSSSSYAIIRFRTDGATNEGHMGFKALYTVYYEDAYGCEENDFHCDNNRCIDSSLVCDENDHCGDDSDEVKGCGGDTDLTWLVIIAIVCGCVLLVGLGICTACCFMNSQMRGRAPDSRVPASRSAASRPTENGTSLAVVSSQNNGMRQPYTNPVFSTGFSATAPPPPRYSDIWNDPVNVPPPQVGETSGHHPIPPPPGTATLYSQHELTYAATTSPPTVNAAGSLDTSVLPPGHIAVRSANFRGCSEGQ